MDEVLDFSGLTGIVISGQEMMKQGQNKLNEIFMEDYDDRFKGLWLYRGILCE